MCPAFSNVCHLQNHDFPNRSHVSTRECPAGKETCINQVEELSIYDNAIYVYVCVYIYIYILDVQEILV